MGARADQDAGAEPAGGADHSQDPGPGPERPGRSAQRADHGAAFHLREREQLSLRKKSGLALAWPAPFRRRRTFCIQEEACIRARLESLTRVIPRSGRAMAAI